MVGQNTKKGCQVLIQHPFNKKIKNMPDIPFKWEFSARGKGPGDSRIGEAWAWRTKNQYVLIQNDMRYQIALLRHPTIHESHGWVTGATAVSSCPIFLPNN